MVAVKLLDEVGIRDVVDLAKKMGITTLVETGRYNDLGLAPIALGGLTHGVTVLEMASAYGVYANQGVRVPGGHSQSGGCRRQCWRSISPRNSGNQRTNCLYHERHAERRNRAGYSTASRHWAAGSRQDRYGSELYQWLVYRIHPSLVTAVWMGDDEQSQDMVYKGVRYGSWNTAQI